MDLIISISIFCVFSLAAGISASTEYSGVKERSTIKEHAEQLAHLQRETANLRQEMRKLILIRQKDANAERRTCARNKYTVSNPVISGITSVRRYVGFFPHFAQAPTVVASVAGFSTRKDSDHEYDFDVSTEDVETSGFVIRVVSRGTSLRRLDISWMACL